LCIWGEFANKFDLGADEHPVIAIKRATVSDWGGKSLNSNEDSQIIVNPPHPRTKVLQEWYKYLPDTSSIGSVTQNQRNDLNLSNTGGDNQFEQRPRQKLLIKEMVD
jgi:hypothetical protein